MGLVKFKPRTNGHWPSLFDDFFADVPELRTRNYQPAVNIKEGEEGFTLEVAAPGATKEDFELTIDRNVLTVSSKVENKSEESNEEYTRKEFSYMNFSRSFNMPETVDLENVKAKYENGILNVSIPKKKEAVRKLSRTVSVE